jgi:hypothetical protein
LSKLSLEPHFNNEAHAISVDVVPARVGELINVVKVLIRLCVSHTCALLAKVGVPEQKRRVAGDEARANDLGRIDVVFVSVIE